MVSQNRMDDFHFAQALLARPRVMAVMAKHWHVPRVPLPTNATLLSIAALRGMGYCQCLEI